ncbi:28965_t:CDS:2, partial [Racocetra persica]
FKLIRSEIDLLVTAHKNQLNHTYSSNNNWERIKTIIDLLYPVLEATEYLSGSSYPTIFDVRLTVEEQKTEQPPEEELDLYLSLPMCQTNPLSWWEQNEYRFPILAVIETSVPYEEAFSVAAETITKVRSCLLSETAQALLCLKSWMKQNIRI